LNYEEKISLLDEGDFFALFSRFAADPRWVTSAGKQAIQILGHCHGGEHHSALFDPDTIKVNCFSECGGGMLLHTWVKRTIGSDDPQQAKDLIEDWIENQEIDLSGRIAKSTDFGYKERPYEPGPVEMVAGMPEEVLQELYSKFDTTIETLQRLTWCREDGIDAGILNEFDIAYCVGTGDIILPHHNILGDIVGLYARSFKPLRKQVKEENPEMEYRQLVQFPRAKYVPLLRAPNLRTESHTSWSFPNSRNLYGLHKAAEAIKQSGKAIIFEGGKSVMLARQYGYPYAVATHTFGAHLNHISMLIECGAKEIILAFDKQYEEEFGQSWELYERKTRTLAIKAGEYVQVSRMRDKYEVIDFKDAPIDKGFETFETMYFERENLTTTQEQVAAETLQAIKRSQHAVQQMTVDALKGYAINLNF
jgi:hypothetical protein